MMMKSRRLRRAECTAKVGDTKNTDRILVLKPVIEYLRASLRKKSWGNIKVDHRKTVFVDVNQM